MLPCVREVGWGPTFCVLEPVERGARPVERRDEELFQLAGTLVEGMGFKLVAVEDVVERGRRLFRFYIDHPRGITLEDCGSVSRELEYLLDADFDFAGSYVLEVSSPGLDHALKTEREFEHFVGSRVRVVLRGGESAGNVVVGKLAAAGSGTVSIESDDGERLSISMVDIARAQLTG